MNENKKVITLEITGAPSGDYENNCIDVSQEEFKRLTGFEPIEYDESYFYKNLFRYYDVLIPYKYLHKYIEESGKGSIFKLKITCEIEKVGEAEEKD